MTGSGERGAAPEWWVVSSTPTGPFDGIVDFSRELAAAINETEPARVIASHAGLAETAGTTPRGIFLQFYPQAFVTLELPKLLSNLSRLRARGVPVVTTVHEYWPPPSGSIKRGVWRWLCRRALNAVASRSSRLVVTTPYAGRFLAESGIRAAADAAVIPVGTNIPAAARSPKGQPLAIAMFGQPAIFDRGVVLALARWIEKQSPRPRWFWNARNVDEMRAWWRDLGAPDVIEFHGGQPAADVGKLLGEADLAVGLYDDGASTRRGTIAAFIATGLPIVAFDGRYTDDLLRKSGGFLFSPLGDAPAFIRNLERAINDEPLRREMAAASSRLHDSHMSWSRIAEQYLEIARKK